MPQIGVQASCGHRFSTRCGASQEPVNGHPFSPHTIFSTSLSARSLPWHIDHDNGHQDRAIHKLGFSTYVFFLMKCWAIENIC